MKLLMCPPDFYGIEYEINPWMDVQVNADRKKAEQQWKGLHKILTKEMGIEVELMKPIEGVPDLVFTANGGFIWNQTVVLANFRFAQRKKEESFFQKKFKALGLSVSVMPDDMLFEGEGDLLLSGKTLFAGYRFRSDISSHARIGELLDVPVLSLELTDPRFYHLDTCFFPLSGGEVVYYPDAFDGYARKVIESHFPKEKLIVVAKEEALVFACNGVEVKRKVVINAGCSNLRKELEKWEYTVYETDLSEFIKAGGSAKCLTLWLER